VSSIRLAEAWGSLLERRRALGPSLAPYAGVLSAWEALPLAPRPPLGWTAESCWATWERGTPLLSAAPVALAPDEIEPFLAPALEALVAAGIDPEPLRRFAAMWDAGELGPADLLPRPGRLGSIRAAEGAGLSATVLAFLTCAALRPWLDAHFAECRAHLRPGAWRLGICPFCGTPPGFAELLDDGQRWLACHVCAGTWTFARLGCPYCGTDRPADLARLMAEAGDEGYALAACKACLGYVKELDRRLRWNAGPALVEDWGSPHLDVYAAREGFWRGTPSLAHLLPPEAESPA
jgi:FdhE protein